MKVVLSDYLFDTVPAPTDRWSRFRTWLENRYDRIGLPYVWPLVRRSVNKPKAIAIGGVLYCHPAIWDQLKKEANNAQLLVSQRGAPVPAH